MLQTVSNCVLFSLYTPECLPIPFGLSHNLVRRIQAITASKLQHSTFNSLSETPVNLYLQQVQVTGHVCLCLVFLRVGWVGWVLHWTTLIHFGQALKGIGYQIGRSHVSTPVTLESPIPSSAFKISTMYLNNA